MYSISAGEHSPNNIMECAQVLESWNEVILGNDKNGFVHSKQSNKVHYTVFYSFLYYAGNPPPPPPQDIFGEDGHDGA